MTNEDTLIPTDACNSLHLMEITISDYPASIKKIIRFLHENCVENIKSSYNT